MSFKSLSQLLQGCITLMSLYMAYNGYWIGLLLIIPSILGDLILRWTSKGMLPIVFKIIILLQGLVIWIYLITNSVDQASFERFPSSNRLFPALLKNYISRPVDNVGSKGNPDLIADIPTEKKRNQLQIENIELTAVPRLDSKLKGVMLEYEAIKSISKVENNRMKTNNVDSLKFPESSLELTTSTFGELLPSNHPDLKYRTQDIIRGRMTRVFRELPRAGFDPSYRSPCWTHPKDLRTEFGPPSKSRVESSPYELEDGNLLTCLPLVYILGQPKCGTSDLYERLSKHPDIVTPNRKEVRWFTRGEFTTTALPKDVMINEDTSIFSFTDHFNKDLQLVQRRPGKAVILDGGPHTLWWPTQSPDELNSLLTPLVSLGSALPDEIPAAQMIREIYGERYPLRFLVTVSDPVRRMYSDYHFIDDNLMPVRANHPSSKSPTEFHERASIEVNTFRECVKGGEDVGLSFFRSSQICAHDRHRFAVGGWGRLGISLYVLYIEKWLEHFSPDQFMVLRMEEYDLNPKMYMRKVFEFLGLEVPDGDAGLKLMQSVVSGHIANEHRINREPMLEETESMLRDFFAPYNELLAKLLDDKSFLWKHGPNNPGNRHGGGITVDTPEIQTDVVKLPFLRGIGNLKLKPRSFSLEGLVQEDNINEFLSHVMQGPLVAPTNMGQAADFLACATLGLDLAALRFLLHDVGVPADITHPADNHRNAFHFLGLVFMMSDAHSKSHVFSLLKGKRTWLSDYFDPPLEDKLESVLSRDIVDKLDRAILRTAQWLIRAGTPVDALDDSGSTPLHFASQGGCRSLVRLLLRHGVNVDRTNRDGRTAMHLALAHGHAEVAGMLKEAGADMNIADVFGANPTDMLMNPGPILPEDAIRYLNTTQRAVRRIYRFKQPELHSDFKNLSGWPGTGGWGPERLAGFEDEMSCDVDQYWAHEITPEDIFYKYMVRMAPVLIRGLLHEWPAIQKYQKDVMRRDHGDLDVESSSIPYSRKFGGLPVVNIKLKDYIDQVIEHRIDGGHHPYYVFRGHPVPKQSDKENSLVAHADCPTPDLLADAFRMYPSDSYPTDKKKAEARTIPESEDYVKHPRYMFVNAQWALGGEGTGAPIHYHNTAWNALLYGAKKWLIYPPHYMIMSNKQILDYFETDMKTFADRGVRPHTCIQTAGDVLIIPESWGHGVLNLQESVAVASEVRHSLWRIRPFPRAISLMPDDNRASRPSKNDQPVVAVEVPGHEEKREPPPFAAVQQHELEMDKRDLSQEIRGNARGEIRQP